MNGVGVNIIILFLSLFLIIPVKTLSSILIGVDRWVLYASFRSLENLVSFPHFRTLFAPKTFIILHLSCFIYVLSFFS